MQYTNLLKPGHIGSLQLKNRLIYSAMDLRSADGQGHMTQRPLTVYYCERSMALVLSTFPATLPGPHQAFLTAKHLR